MSDETPHLFARHAMSVRTRQMFFCCIPSRRLSILDPSSQYVAVTIMIRSIAEQGIHFEIVVCRPAARIGAPSI